jgi:hypothetical protein
MLLKPYSIEELLGTVKEVLDAADSSIGPIKQPCDGQRRSLAVNLQPR